MVDIPTKGKYSSLKAPWRSIIKGIESFLPQINWKIKGGDSQSFGSFLHENIPLSLHNPWLYTLTTIKWDSIKDIWNIENSKLDPFS